MAIEHNLTHQTIPTLKSINWLNIQFNGWRSNLKIWSLSSQEIESTRHPPLNRTLQNLESLISTPQNGAIGKVGKYNYEITIFQDGYAKINNLREWTLLGLVQRRSVETRRLLESWLLRGSFGSWWNTNWKPWLCALSGTWMARTV